MNTKETELRNDILYSVSYSLAKKSYLQGFGINANKFYATINIFDKCKISDENYKRNRGKPSKI